MSVLLEYFNALIDTKCISILYGILAVIIDLVVSASITKINVHQ